MPKLATLGWPRYIALASERCAVFPVWPAIAASEVLMPILGPVQHWLRVPELGRREALTVCSVKSGLQKQSSTSSTCTTS